MSPSPEEKLVAAMATTGYCGSNFGTAVPQHTKHLIYKEDMRTNHLLSLISGKFRLMFSQGLITYMWEFKRPFKEEASTQSLRNWRIDITCRKDRIRPHNLLGFPEPPTKNIWWFLLEEIAITWNHARSCIIHFKICVVDNIMCTQSVFWMSHLERTRYKMVPAVLVPVEIWWFP